MSIQTTEDRVSMAFERGYREGFRHFKNWTLIFTAVGIMLGAICMAAILRVLGILL